LTRGVDKKSLAGGRPPKPKLVLRFLVPASFVVGGLAIFLSIVCILIFQQMDTTQQNRLLTQHNQDVLSDANQLSVLIRDAERGQRGYVLTGDHDYVQPFEAAHERLQPLSDHLRQLVAGNSLQRNQLSLLLSLIRRKFAELQQTIQLRTDFGEDSAKRVIMNDNGLKLMDEITLLLDAMTAEENRVLAGRNALIDRTWTSMHLSAAGGSVAAMVLVALAALTLNRDASRREIDREKDQRRDELALSNADLEDFAYAASHDLKAPLRAIANLVRWIAEDIMATASAETLSNLKLVEARVTRLQMLLDGLLAYSRVGRDNRAVESVDIAEMVRDISASLAPPPGFVIVCEGPMSPVRTHRVPMRAVLENLISNGLKHHDRAEGRVAVSMVLAGGMAEFRVSDDGPGIAKPFHERIFLIFQTLESRDDAGSGGVGLAIVMKHVKANGGQIRVESAPPARGTTFVVTWKEAAP
jgi:signal transduction histidine kinase